MASSKYLRRLSPHSSEILLLLKSSISRSGKVTSWRTYNKYDAFSFPISHPYILSYLSWGIWHIACITISIPLKSSVWLTSISTLFSWIHSSRYLFSSSATFGSSLPLLLPPSMSSTLWPVSIYLFSAVGCYELPLLGAITW